MSEYRRVARDSDLLWFPVGAVVAVSTRTDGKKGAVLTGPIWQDGSVHAIPHGPADLGRFRRFSVATLKPGA